jgi:hypothetical protein
MDLNIFLKKGFALRMQRPGLTDDGPITPCLRAMAATDALGKPLSPVGADVARLFSQRTTRVLFVHTAGSGITPWRGLFVLDAEYRGEGQTKSPATIGLVAHELTHLLQRELKPRYYWPSGRLRPSLTRRWVGDSTNYMEVLAYLVGWSVEHDLTAAQAASPGLSAAAQERYRRILKSIRDRLATLAGADVKNAARLVLKTYPDNPVYRKNYRLESRLRDGRVPPGMWHGWLRQLGFSPAAVDHILLLAARGQVERIDPTLFA